MGRDHADLGDLCADIAAVVLGRDLECVDDIAAFIAGLDLPRRLRRFGGVPVNIHALRIADHCADAGVFVASRQRWAAIDVRRR